MGQNAELIFEWYLVTLLLFFGVIAVLSGWRDRANRWKISEEKLCRCPDCHLTFIVPRRQWFSECPRCCRKCRVKERFQPQH